MVCNGTSADSVMAPALLAFAHYVAVEALSNHYI